MIAFQKFPQPKCPSFRTTLTAFGNAADIVYSNKYYAGFEVITAVIMTSSIFWDMCNAM
jgi:hypothetical protein